MHNFCDKREQSSLLRLPSGAKITTEGSNAQCTIMIRSESFFIFVSLIRLIGLISHISIWVGVIFS